MRNTVRLSLQRTPYPECLWSCARSKSTVVVEFMTEAMEAEVGVVVVKQEGDGVGLAGRK